MSRIDYSSSVIQISKKISLAQPQAIGHHFLCMLIQCKQIQYRRAVPSWQMCENNEGQRIMNKKVKKSKLNSIKVITQIF